MANLNGRLDRLERGVLTAASPPSCRTCGLLHAPRPIPVAMVEGIVRAAVSGQPPAVPPLCLCDCCGDQRQVALMTHGGGARDAPSGRATGSIGAALRP